MDFSQAKMAFSQYLKGFDPADGRIQLKTVHTYHVIKISEYIAKSLGLDDNDVDLAKRIALLHDLARFIQAKEYGHFLDAHSFNHGEKAVELLQREDFIRAFNSLPEEDSLIFKAILNHNRYQIEAGLSAREELHAKIIRDADKLDIFRVATVDPIEAIFHFSKTDLENSLISEEVYHDFLAGKAINHPKRKHPADFIIAMAGFIFDINFQASLSYIAENDYLNQLLDRANLKNPESQKQLEQIRAVANAKLSQ
jgi:putative nucleotidyltransferase with HDIG domain